ncbi:MAG TPA: DUF3551 domain-containing protein [Pseudolabrys sp.]|nr:DUF3551 domain-containing protein [Pseudolabrys sp.]
MRTKIIVLATLVLSTEAFAQSPVRNYAFPHDPYRWCAVYGGDAGGASNCGFLTIEQCRANVSGIGGFCEPNQFYNPGKPSQTLGPQAGAGAAAAGRW